ncbi:DUF3107 domain-containing protein [Corynebacterium sp. 335C]
MDITIGFVDVARELTIAGAEGGEELRGRIADALSSGSGVLEIADAQGRTHLARVEKIAYVQIGAASNRHVGFIA